VKVDRCNKTVILGGRDVALWIGRQRREIEPQKRKEAGKGKASKEERGG
jgi:hypothetical protein